MKIGINIRIGNFKIGDRVKVVTMDPDSSQSYLGLEGNVIDINHRLNSKYPITIKLDEDPDTLGFHAGELELIEENQYEEWDD